MSDAKPPAKERDENGYFLPGNQVAKGHKNATMREFNKKFREMFEDDLDWRPLVRQLYAIATDEVGAKPNERINAINSILDRLLGKPVQGVHIDATETFTKLFAFEMKDAVGGA
jgi:hypothetical protein